MLESEGKGQSAGTQGASKQCNAGLRLAGARQHLASSYYDGDGQRQEVTAGNA
jgi:hypothetical protein